MKTWLAVLVAIWLQLAATGAHAGERGYLGLAMAIKATGATSTVTVVLGQKPG